MAPRNPFVFTRDDYEQHVRTLALPRVSQRSEYDEVELVEDCTLFDLYRQPRQPVTDPAATRTLLVRVLNAELTCPICLGIIRQTEVVMECLHRFCGDCIQRSLRVGKNECPSCRIHIPSKRSLRRDTNFDALIAKIYPNLDEFNEQEEKLIEELNRERHFHNARTTSTKMGVQNQQTLRRNNGKKKLSTDADGETSLSDAAASSTSNGHSGDKRTPSWDDTAPATSAATNGSTARKKPRTAVATTDSSPSTSATTEAAASSSAEAAPAPDKDDDKVNFRLALHPEEDSDAVPLLGRTLFRTSYKLKVRHLKKHLIALLKLESFKNMRIVLPAKNCSLSGLSARSTIKGDEAADGDNKVAIRKDLTFDQELEDYVTLYDIYQQYGMGTKWELQLYYHFSDSILNGVAQFITSGV